MDCNIYKSDDSYEEVDIAGDPKDYGRNDPARETQFFGSPIIILLLLLLLFMDRKL